MGKQFVSELTGLKLHSAGWWKLASGAEITRLPVWDDGTALFARLGHGPASAWAAPQGLRLPTKSEYDELHRAALFIAPFTMPTIDQLRDNAISPANVAAVDAYRNANMTSLEWCRIHDGEVFRRLTAAGWQVQPVSNAGKHWVDGGLIYGWWKADGRVIQPLSSAHRAMPTHTDYATNFHLVRPAVASSTTTKDEPKAQAIEKIQARNYTKAGRTAVDLVVLHSTENPIRRGVARSVALWFGGTSAPQASAHYVVGPDATFQCVDESDVAWAAPGANRQGIQIEQVGQAARTDWTRDGDGIEDGLRVLERSAELVRGICERWSIPVERLTAADLLAGKRGITTHAAVTEAWKKSSHVDPGCVGDTRWPWDLFISLVKASKS